MRRIVFLACLMCATSSAAETVFATKTIRAKQIVTSDDIRLDTSEVAGGVARIEDVLGAELKRAVYAGRPILRENVSKPALVERNQLVRAEFTRNGLVIETEARALERGAVGDVIQAMNVSSRKTIQATITPNGTLRVMQ